MKNMKNWLHNGIRGLKWKNFIGLLIAGAINACGVVLFLSPVKLYDGGISGTAMLINQVSNFSFPALLVIINIPIFIFGAKKQGVSFTIYSLFVIGVYSLIAFLFQEFLPKEFLTEKSPLADTDLLLCAVFGGVLSGIGSGLSIRFGGAIDGMDVLSVIFAKKIGISIGTFVMIFDTILYITCGLVMQNWILPLYSIIAYFAGSKAVDFVVEGIDRSKCAMIVTTKADEISGELSKSFQSSGTIVNAIGGYTKEDKQIIYFIVNRFQINKMKEIVQTIDPLAYISLHDITDTVIGKKSV